MLGPRALGWASPCLITLHGTVQDAHCPFLRVRDSWGEAPGSGVEGSTPQVLELVEMDFASVRVEFPTAGANP
jgi:hypothetical protein